MQQDAKHNSTKSNTNAYIFIVPFAIAVLSSNSPTLFGKITAQISELDETRNLLNFRVSNRKSTRSHFQVRYIIKYNSSD